LLLFKFLRKKNRVKALILVVGGGILPSQSRQKPFRFLFAWQMKGKPFEVIAKSPESVSGNSFCGSTGHWPVPPGDSPGETGSATGGNKDRRFGSSRFALPLGESPSGTGGSPVLPIFRRRCEPGAVAALRGQRKELPPNDFHQPAHRFIGIDSAILTHDPTFLH